MMARRLLVAVVVAMSLAPGLAAREAVAQSGQPSGVPVEVARTEKKTVTIEATAVGTLLSNESIVVRPEIDGRIVAIHFEEGVEVENGAPLFSLDDSIYAAELADAKARLELAEKNFERTKELVRKGAGTARSLDQDQAELATATAAINLASARLEKTSIEAPFAGVAGLRRVSVGAYVSAGTDLVNLEDIDPIKVQFSIPERYLSALEEKQTVRVTADAFPERTFAGEVYAINPQINPTGRSITIRARIDNEDRVLRPGLFVRVRLELENRENAIVIPEQALVPRGEDRFVFKVEEGKAVETKVETGQRRFGQVEILSGLEDGDTVVTAGQLKIGDGAPVTPVNQAETAGSSRPGNDDPSGEGS